VTRILASVSWEGHHSVGKRWVETIQPQQIPFCTKFICIQTQLVAACHANPPPSRGRRAGLPPHRPGGSCRGPGGFGRHRYCAGRSLPPGTVRLPAIRSVRSHLSTPRPIPLTASAPVRRRRRCQLGWRGRASTRTRQDCSQLDRLFPAATLQCCRLNSPPTTLFRYTNQRERSVGRTGGVRGDLPIYSSGYFGSRRSARSSARSITVLTSPV